MYSFYVQFLSTVSIYIHYFKFPFIVFIYNLYIQLSCMYIQSLYIVFTYIPYEQFLCIVQYNTHKQSLYTVLLYNSYTQFSYTVLIYNLYIQFFAIQFSFTVIFMSSTSLILMNNFYYSLFFKYNQFYKQCFSYIVVTIHILDLMHFLFSNSIVESISVL